MKAKSGFHAALLDGNITLCRIVVVATNDPAEAGACDRALRIEDFRPEPRTRAVRSAP